MAEGLAPFELGIGLSTGTVAAALLGSDERVEYTLVGDAVNLCQRLQQFAEPGQTVLSEATWDALTEPPDGSSNWSPSWSRAATRRSSGSRAGQPEPQPRPEPQEHRNDRYRRLPLTDRRRAAARAGGRGTRLPHVRTGHGARASPARCRPHGRRRRVRRRHGAIGLRQVDACSTSSPGSTSPTRAR